MVFQIFFDDSDTPQYAATIFVVCWVVTTRESILYICFSSEIDFISDHFSALKAVF